MDAKYIQEYKYFNNYQETEKKGEWNGTKQDKWILSATIKMGTEKCKDEHDN